MSVGSVVFPKLVAVGEQVDYVSIVILVGHVVV